MSGFFKREEVADRKEKQMQGFRTYYDPIGMLLLHPGSMNITECEKEAETTIDHKAG